MGENKNLKRWLGHKCIHDTNMTLNYVPTISFLQKKTII